MISTRSPSGTIEGATAVLHPVLVKGKPSPLNELTHDLGLPRQLSPEQRNSEKRETEYLAKKPRLFKNK